MERKKVFLFFSVGQLLSHASFVPPATNVTLDCHNFQNTLRWDYSQHDSLKPRFKVTVQALTGMPEPLLIDYPNLQCDLSSFSSPENDYRVTVTALVGLNESDPAPPDGWTYSYFYSTPSAMQCLLDLQSVNVTVQSGAGIKFRFNHPSVLYRHKLLTKPKRRQRKPDARQAKKVSMFTYDVVVTNNKMNYQFDCVTDVCEESLPAELQQHSSSYCVKIDGHWENVAVRSTQEYCTESVLPPATSHQALYIGFGVLALGLMAFLILTLTFCFKKIHGFSPMPSVLNIGRIIPDRRCDTSDTPLIHEPTSMSPVSVSSFELPAEDNRETAHLASATSTAADMEHEVFLPVNRPLAPDGSVPWAPEGEGAAEPFDTLSSQAAEITGQDDPSVEPRAPDDPGRAAGDIGPVKPNAGSLGDGAPEVERIPEVAPHFEDQNSGYEQRERLVIVPGDQIDAYHC